MRQTEINAERPEIVRRVEGLFELADQLDLRLAQARGQVVEKFGTSSSLRPSSPRSGQRRVARLARAYLGQLVPRAEDELTKIMQSIR